MKIALELLENDLRDIESSKAADKAKSLTFA